MSEMLRSFFLKIFPFFLIFSLSISVGCSTIKDVIHPSENSAASSEPAIQKGNYKGLKAKIVVTKFIDKSSKVKTGAQTENDITEMLGNELLATNRFVVQMRLSGNGSKQPIRGADLLVEGTITQFEPGKGLIIKTPSLVTFLLKVSDIKTGRKLISQDVEGKAAPTEKAIKMAIEESIKIIVAKIPPEYYRASSPPPPAFSPPPNESPKPQQNRPETTSLPPTPPPVKSEASLRVVQVVWSYVNLREGPGTSYKNVGSIKQGASMTLLEERGDWLRVRLSDRKEAWVSKQATTLAPHTPPTPSNIPAPASTPPKPNPM